MADQDEGAATQAETARIIAEAEKAELDALEQAKRELEEAKSAQASLDPKAIRRAAQREANKGRKLSDVANYPTMVPSDVLAMQLPARGGFFGTGIGRELTEPRAHAFRRNDTPAGGWTCARTACGAEETDPVQVHERKDCRGFDAKVSP